MTKALAACSLLGISCILAACGGSRTVPGTTTPKGQKTVADGDSRPTQSPAPTLARTEVLSLDFLPEEDHPGTLRLVVVSTDETGAARRLEIDSYSGSCQRTEIDQGDRAIDGEILAAQCRQDDTGVNIRFVKRQGQLVRLEAPWTKAEADLPPSYEERGVTPLPSGAKITVAPLSRVAGD